MTDYLNHAAREAWKGAKRGRGGPFGAVIVRNRRVISKAHNTVLASHDPTAHAEVNAIRLAARKLKTPFLRGATIYSTTEPCPMCFSAIHWAQIKKIVYATGISDVKKLGFNELTVSNVQLKKWGKSKVQIIQKDNQRCVDILQQWTRLSKKKTY